MPRSVDGRTMRRRGESEWMFDVWGGGSVRSRERTGSRYAAEHCTSVRIREGACDVERYSLRVLPEPVGAVKMVFLPESSSGMI